MSRTIQCCLVRPDAVRAAIGSRDQVLLERAPLRLIDPTRRRDAVGLIEADELPGADAATGLPGLCELLGGKWLPNDRWAPYRLAELEAVDAALSAVGGGQISDLVAAATHRLGGIEASPEMRITGWAAREITGLRDRFAGVDAVAESHRAAIAQVVAWLDAALAARTGLVLIDW